MQNNYLEWGPSELASASMADLFDLQTECYRLKAAYERHKAIFDIAMEQRHKPNDYGKKTLDFGEYKVTVDHPKRVKWDKGLGDLDLDCIRAKYDMTETAYKALSPQNQRAVDKYRTVEGGKINWRIERDD